MLGRYDHGEKDIQEFSPGGDYVVLNDGADLTIYSVRTGRRLKYMNIPEKSYVGDCEWLNPRTLQVNVYPNGKPVVRSIIKL